MNAPFFFLQESSNNVVMEPEEEDRKQYLEDFMVKVKKAKLQKVIIFGLRDHGKSLRCSKFEMI